MRGRRDCGDADISLPNSIVGMKVKTDKAKLAIKGTVYAMLKDAKSRLPLYHNVHKISRLCLKPTLNLSLVDVKCLQTLGSEQSWYHQSLSLE